MCSEFKTEFRNDPKLYRQSLFLHQPISSSKHYVWNLRQEIVFVLLIADYLLSWRKEKAKSIISPVNAFTNKETKGSAFRDVALAKCKQHK